MEPEHLEVMVLLSTTPCVYGQDGKSASDLFTQSHADGITYLAFPAPGTLPADLTYL